MRDLLEKLGKHGFAVSVSLMLTRLLGFVMVPVMTERIGKVEYGIHDALAQVGSLMALLAAQGVPSAVFRQYAFSAQSDAERRAVIATGFRYTAISTLFLAVVLGALARPMAVTLTGSSDYAVLYLLVLLTYAFGNMKSICAQILRAEYRSREFVIVYCGEFILCVGLNIYFVVLLKLGLAGFVYSNLIGAALAFLLAVSFVPQGLAPTFRRDIAKDLIGFGWPLVPPALALTLLDSIDRFLFIGMLGKEAGADANGLYGRAATFASILHGVLLLPFTTYWPSVYYELAKREHAAVDLGRCASYYAAVAAFLATGLSVVAKPLVALMTEAQFHPAWAAVPPLAFSLALYGLSEVTRVGMFVAGRTRRMPVLVVVALAVNVALNLVLIPRIGFVAAAWASLGAYGSLALTCGLASQRLFRLKFEWARLLKVAVAVGVTLGLNFAVDGFREVSRAHQILELLARGCAAAILLPALLLALGFFTPWERELALGVLGRARSRLNRGGGSRPKP